MKTIVADVRFARRTDARALADVHEAAWRSTYGGVIPYRALARMISRRGPGWWESAVSGGAAILVLEFDGQIVGYATIGRNRTRALFVGGEIYEIYLLPEFQGLGFGGKLFRAARSILASRHLKGLAVWALEDNAGALSFYRGLGGADIAAGSEVFDGVRLPKVAFVWQ